MYILYSRVVLDESVACSKQKRVATEGTIFGKPSVATFELAGSGVLLLKSRLAANIIPRLGSAAVAISGAASRKSYNRVHVQGSFVKTNLTCVSVNFAGEALPVYVVVIDTFVGGG